MRITDITAHSHQFCKTLPVLTKAKTNCVKIKVEVVLLTVQVRIIKHDKEYLKVAYRVGCC